MGPVGKRELVDYGQALRIAQCGVQLRSPDRIPPWILTQ